MDIGEVPAAPSVESIKKAEYKKAGELYGGVLDGKKAEYSPSLFRETEKTLSLIPEEHKQQVLGFAAEVTKLIPQRVFTEASLAPSGREGLSALVATAYGFDELAQTNPSRREMYVRALSAMSAYSLCFANGMSDSNTEEVMHNFTQGRFERDEFFNFLVDLSVQTMPIADYRDDRREANANSYQQFLEGAKPMQDAAWRLLSDSVGRFMPDLKMKNRDSPPRPVHVKDLHRLKLFTNDPKIVSEKRYGNVVAGAVAFGIDEISGLALTVNVIPYDFEKSQEQPDLEPKDDPAYRDTHMFVHELVHNVSPDKEDKGDWQKVINELLTDTASEIIMLRAYGQPFVERPPAYQARVGYMTLVDLGRFCQEWICYRG